MVDFPRGDTLTEYFTNLLAFRHRYDFYEAEGGKTRVLLTLSVPSHPGDKGTSPPPRPDMQLMVTAWNTKTGEIVRQASQTMRRDDARSSNGDDSLFFQDEFAVDPGTYQFDITFFEPESHLGNKHSQTMEVPDFRQKFALSSIAMGHLPMGPAGPLPPLREGSVILVAEPVPAFVPEDSMAFAYQVYNACRRGKVPDLSVEYRFMMEGEDGLRQVGQSVSQEHLNKETFAFSLPLHGWPEATYRVEIRVTDNLDGATVTGEENFVVRSPSRQGP
jgi:hypothetical protein